MRRGLTFVLMFAVVLCVHSVRGQDEYFEKTTDDIETKYTTVGNIGLTITNFGTIGTRNYTWPQQPSCEYPRGSRIEHVYQGGLWVGALIRTADSLDPRNNLIAVTTATNDRASSSRRTGEGYEFVTEIGDTVRELSSLPDDRPPSSIYSPLAVSHQDFVSEYTDRYTRVPQTNDTILNHIPLKINIHQESYAWNFPFADFFVILRYVITNVSRDTLDSVYIGLWNNAVVRNTNLVRPGTPGYFDHGAHGYDSLQRMVYSFDWDGIPGGPPADSYIGLKLLGTTPFPKGVDSLGDLHNRTYFNAWRYRSSSGEQVFFSPTDDENTDRYLSRYGRMTQSMPQDRIDALRKAPPAGLAPINVTYLFSVGPYPRLTPNDTLEVVLAVVCAKKDGSGPARDDTPAQRRTLYSNGGWAQQAYNGEDVNGNNILDEGEDIARRDSVSPSEVGLRYEPDGRITRYLLPTPPRRPKVHAEVEDRDVVIYWDRTSSEESVDPITGQYDFEGYRVYRSGAGMDFMNHDAFLVDPDLVGEFDRADDNVGYNTGFSRILLDEPKIFEGDTVQYWYRFPPKGEVIKHLNGWQYMYGVSAYDKGDSANNVLSLESAKVLKRVIPGTRPTSAPEVAIGVYPNPYYANAYWDGDRERLRKIYFYNLPARCEIRIYTLAGDVVTVLDHDAASYDGSGIEWFSQFGDPSTKAEMTGGEHAWDLITRNDQAIATGLYVFTVEDKVTGAIKRGKFLIVK